MKRRSQAVIEPQDVVDLNALFEQLGGIDLGKLNTEKEKKELVERLATDPTLRRNKPGKTGLGRTPKPKPHFRHRRKKNRQWYEAVGKPRRSERKAASLSTAEGWYEHVTRRWDQLKIEHFTYEEFLDTFWPMIRDDGVLPTFRRYDTRNKGYTLDNVYVIDVRPRYVDGSQEALPPRTVWDCTEERLRSLGAIL